MAKPKYLLVDRCPCPYDIAPYVHLVLRGAGQTASSIYRGSDADPLLHRFGLHDQAEIHRMMPNISNPEGLSQHDLHSDGNANPGPPGRRLETWEIGVDSGANDETSKQRVEHSAQAFGWEVRHPYSRGVEGHHWCFARRPRPHGPRQYILIVRTRRMLRKQTAKALA